MSADGVRRYKSLAQLVRVVTETWGEQNLYCPNCPSPKLDRLQNNTEALDFACPRCGFGYQLKGQGRPFHRHITDGGYDAMMRAIVSDQTPNFFFMNYDGTNWRIRDLLLVPHFAFPASAIIRREPLGPATRRAGWVGCNFDLRRIPIEARIEVVKAGEIAPAAEVRRQFKRVKPLQEVGAKERGWTLDVLTAVRRLCKQEFTNNDAYAFAHELEQLHPDNRHVRDKIRQQLQVLRDAKLLIHVSSGVWRLP
jgi:type II restriction enzyme